MHRQTDPARLGRLLAQGTAFIVALVEAASVQARPVAPDGLRLNVRNTPQPAGDAYQAGRGLLAAGDVPAALAAFRQAVLEDPQSVDALSALAICYDRLGRFDVSRSYYDSALAIDAGSALVLNNLGYSLYLQGDLQAAIPVLQRAMVGADPTVTATSQRVLNLVAAQLSANRVHQDIAAVRADIASPRAHIELSADGEHRLVFGGKAAAPSLVASLGDAAALITIAAPMPTREDAAYDPQAGFQAKAAIMAAADPLPGARPMTIEIRVAATNAEPGVVYFPAPPAAAAPRLASSVKPVAGSPVAAIETLLLAAPQPVDRKHPRLRLAAKLTPELVVSVDGSLGVARRAITANPRALAPNLVSTDTAIVAAGTADPTAPAWLLASRRIAKGHLGGAAVSQGPRQHDALPAFESDDAELNDFAARMRGDAIRAVNDNALVTQGSGADRAAIIARLEALMARVRAA